MLRALRLDSISRTVACAELSDSIETPDPASYKGNRISRQDNDDPGLRSGGGATIKSAPPSDATENGRAHSRDPTMSRAPGFTTKARRNGQSRPLSPRRTISSERKSIPFSASQAASVDLPAPVGPAMRTILLSFARTEA